jgi:hypothetical protein
MERLLSLLRIRGTRPARKRGNAGRDVLALPGLFFLVILEILAFP